jgi:hypothetical protein
VWLTTHFNRIKRSTICGTSQPLTARGVRPDHLDAAVFLQKLIVAQLVKILSEFYGSRKFITVFTILVPVLSQSEIYLTIIFPFSCYGLRPVVNTQSRFLCRRTARDIPAII